MRIYLIREQAYFLELERFLSPKNSPIGECKLNFTLTKSHNNIKILVLRNAKVVDCV